MAKEEPPEADRQAIAVVLSFFDGHVEQGVALVPRHDERAASLASRIAGFLNMPEDFFELCDRSEDASVLVRKARIRWVELEAPFKLEKADRAGIAHEIWVAFPRGDILRGNIYDRLPAGRRRVLDFLNQPEMFFILDAGEKTYLVNRRATARAYDAMPSAATA